MPEGQVFNGNLARFTDGNRATTASGLSATINWGDGTATPGTVSGSNGLFTVAGNHTYLDEGRFMTTVTLTADAPDSGTGTAMGAASVSEADRFSLIHTNPVFVMEGQTFSGALASFSDSFGAQTASGLSVVINWGDGSSSAGSVAGGGGTFTVSGSHSYADEGNFTVGVTLRDNSPGSASITTTLTAHVADADVLTGSTYPIAAMEATAFSGAVAAFTDADSATPASDFTATITWGDGPTTTGSVTGSNGSFIVTGSHTYAEEGAYPVKVTMSEKAPGTATATITSTANVADKDVLVGNGKTIALSEGISFSGAVATFTNTDTSTPASGFTASINWGDGNSSTGTVSGSNGSFSVSGSHSYTEEGGYTVQVTMSDKAPGTATATATSTANVADRDSLSGSIQTIGGATEGTAWSGAVATFTDSDTSTPASGFTATINWGDGTLTAGTVTGSAGHFTVTGNHTFADEGTFTVQVTLADTAPGTATATVTDTAHVAEGDLLTGISQTIAATQGTPFSGLVAVFSDTDVSTPGSGLTANIDWGDGTTSAGTVSGSSGSFTVSGTHTYTVLKTYSIEVTLTDPTPGTATATAFSMANVTGVGGLTGSGQIISAMEGMPFSGVVASFSDIDNSKTAGDFTASIDWGDGTTTTGSVTGGNGSFTVNGDHIFNGVGASTLRVTLADSATGSPLAIVTGTANVAPAPLTGSITVAPAQGAVSGQVATFTDPDLNDTAADFSATINWGDGTTSAGTITATGMPGLFAVNGNHAFSVYDNLTISVTVYQSAAPIPNGGFEGATLAPWMAGFTNSGTGDGSTAVPLVTTAAAHSGTHSILLGSPPNAASEPLGDSWARHTLTVPVGGAELSFWYNGASQDTIYYDWQELQIQDTGGNVLSEAWKVCDNSETWQQVNLDLSRYAGQTIVLYFNVHQDGYGDNTSMYLDDVAISTPALTLSQDINVPHTGPANPLVNNRPEDTPFPGQNTQSETTLVLGANNKIIVGFNDSGQYDGSTNGHFTGYSVSTDGGNSFTDQGVLPASPDGDVGDPVLARDDVTGEIYFATLDFASADGAASPGIYVFRSTDNGNAFQTPVKVGTSLETDPGAFYDKPWMTVDNASSTGQGTVYLVFRDFGVNHNGIYLTRSTDHGNTWSSPIEIADAGNGNVQGAWVTTGPDHSVYVFWLDETGSHDAIKMKKSTNLGISFGNAVTVTPLNTMGIEANGDLGLIDGSGNYFRSNTFPQAVVNPVTGAIYVVYDDKGLLANDKSDIFFTQSTDGGQTWSAPIRVNDDATSNDQWQPAIAVTPDGTHVGIFWYDRRLDPTDNLIDRYGVIGTVGANNAITFGTNFRVTNQSFAPVFGNDPVVNSVYMGDYDQAVADNSNFYVNWGDNRLGDPDVRFAEIPVTGIGSSGNGSSVSQQATAAQAEAMIQALAAEHRRSTASLDSAELFLAEALQSGWTPTDESYLTALLTKSTAPGQGHPPHHGRHGGHGDDGEHEGHDFADPGWKPALGGGQ